MIKLFKNENGSITVFFAIIFPVIIFLLLFIENKLQCQYIVNETQILLDMSTRAGAMEGQPITTGNSMFCTLGDNAPREAKKMLETNLSYNMLPQEVTNQLLNYDWKELDDPQLKASGIVKMEANFNYESTLPFFSSNKFHITSTTQCQAYTKK